MAHKFTASAEKLYPAIQELSDAAPDSPKFYSIWIKPGGKVRVSDFEMHVSEPSADGWKHYMIVFPKPKPQTFWQRVWARIARKL